MDQSTLGRGLGSLIPPRDNNLDKNQKEKEIDSGKDMSNIGNGSDFVASENQPHEINRAIADNSQAPPERFAAKQASTNPSSPIQAANVSESDLKHSLSRSNTSFTDADAGRIFNLEIDLIKSNPFQPRREFNQEALQELAKSIEEYGILEPLIVYKIETEVPEGTRVEYRLLAGERRLMAAKLLGLKTVSAIIRPDPEESEKLAIALIENIQREDLNAIERARAFARMTDEFGMPQREVAARLSKSREYVANSLRLLSLPMEAQKALEEGKISEGHAKVILAAGNLEERRMLLAQALDNRLTVRELEFVAKNQFLDKSVPTSMSSALQTLDPAFNDLKNRLEEKLGAEVKIKQHGKRAELSITFYSTEEFHNIVEKIIPRES